MKKVLTLLSFVFLNLYLFGQNGLQKITDSIAITTDIGKPFDKGYLSKDITESKKPATRPISPFNYPVEKYIGSAGARGILTREKETNGLSLSIGNDNKFRNLFSNDSSSSYQDFFTILCYSVNSDSILVRVSSRNFPDYITGQGYLITKFCKIDYTAFIDFTGKSYAIINEKVFDLTVNGKVIILVPKSDGSLNFIQVKTPYVHYSDATNYYRSLLEKSEIKSLINLAKQSNQ